MKNTLISTLGMAVTAAAAITLAPPAQAQDACCFNNFRFAGGCQVRPTGGETCAGILAYLNSFDGVGREYCGNTTVRGGWSQVSCSAGAMRDGGAAHTQEPTTIQAVPSERAPRAVSPGTAPQAVEPQTAPVAQGASLIETSAPMKVQFETPVDSTTASAGQVVTGHLTEDLKSGGTVVAPKGSEVQAHLVPTSFWTSGNGDAYAIKATAVKTGDQVVPVNSVAVQAEGGASTHGTQVSVPEGSVVSFEPATAQSTPDAEAALEKRTQEWVKAFNAHEAGALTSLYTDDAVLAPHNAPAVFGRDAIRADFQELFATKNVGIELENLEIVTRGDLAYKAGRYRLHAGDRLIDRGKFLEIWLLMNGQWMLHRDAYSSSLPAPQAKGE
jgi:ketosteroid isomerase-like protein